MILSDRSLREAIAAGRLVIDPLDDDAIQPSSIDVRLDNRFRVFYTARHPYIDVKQPMEDLTELVEVKPDDAFILHPGEFVLGSSLEQIGIPDDLAARLEGKALAVETPVPTPLGWSTMGQLKAGDQVFDEQGFPCVVIRTTEVMLGRPCREVLFSDGSAIVADEQHLWRTCTKAGRDHGHQRTGLVTTGQIGQSLRTRSGEFNHQVALSGPARYPDRALPIDPYVLGAWLGDGTATKSEITCADEPILDEITRAGYKVERRAGAYRYWIGGVGHTRDRLTGRYARNSSLSSALRDLNLLGDKQVPAIYLVASEPQRVALLQGLMDTDGYVDGRGRCEFTSTRECLADAVVELAASLGFRPVKSKKQAAFRGVDCGPAYRVKFTPNRPVFRLPRKLERQPRERTHHLFRAIVDVREMESVPVRCIQVSAPSGLFLVGRSFIPTHNSSLGRLGLMTHSTAGFLDPGFTGHVTLELSNVANLPITLYPGMRIGQIAVFQLTTAAERPYGSRGVGSKYQGQRGPTPSRYWENFRSP